MRFATEAWVYAGQWVAACGHPDCGNVEGAAVEGDPRRQGTGALTMRAESMRCTNCGTVSDVEWPGEAKMRRIDKALSVRIVPQTRNWLPHETVKDLEVENDAHPVGVR